MFNSPVPTSTGTLLLCRDCGVLHPLPPSGPEPDTADIDDLEMFRADHREHTLERALRLPDPILHDRPAWDPMARAWYRVAVGEHAMFVCSSRTSIEEPRHHEVCSSPPSFTLRAEVDESGLRRSLEQHFVPNRLPNERLNAFVTAARDLFAAVEAQSVETSFDDTELPNAEIGPCPLDVTLQLRKVTDGVFSDPWERDRVLDFIDSNVDEYGSLAIRVLREITTSA